MQFAIQVLWERSAKEVAGKRGAKEENDKNKLRPNAVVHIGEKLKIHIFTEMNTNRSCIQKIKCITKM